MIYNYRESNSQFQAFLGFAFLGFVFGSFLELLLLLITCHNNITTHSHSLVTRTFMTHREYCSLDWSMIITLTRPTRPTRATGLQTRTTFFIHNAADSEATQHYQSFACPESEPELLELDPEDDDEPPLLQEALEYEGDEDGDLLRLRRLRPRRLRLRERLGSFFALLEDGVLALLVLGSAGTGNMVEGGPSSEECIAVSAGSAGEVGAAAMPGSAAASAVRPLSVAAPTSASSNLGNSPSPIADKQSGKGSMSRASVNTVTGTAAGVGKAVTASPGCAAGPKLCAAARPNAP